MSAEVSAKRAKARRRAVQALYQWQLGGVDVDAVERQFLDQPGVGKMDQAYFADLIHGVPRRLDEVDALLSPYLDRSLAGVDPVERAILRLATYEFLCRLDVPYRVILNEAVELAKLFGAEQRHRYVNGVLDKVASQVRTLEQEAR